MSKLKQKNKRAGGGNGAAATLADFNDIREEAPSEQATLENIDAAIVLAVKAGEGVKRKIEPVKQKQDGGSKQKIVALGDKDGDNVCAVCGNSPCDWADRHVGYISRKRYYGGEVYWEHDIVSGRVVGTTSKGGRVVRTGKATKIKVTDLE